MFSQQDLFFVLFPIALAVIYFFLYRHARRIGPRVMAIYELAAADPRRGDPDVRINQLFPSWRWLLPVGLAWSAVVAVYWMSLCELYPHSLPVRCLVGPRALVAYIFLKFAWFYYTLSNEDPAKR